MAACSVASLSPTSKKLLEFHRYRRTARHPGQEGSPGAHQMLDAPRHHHERRQRPPRRSIPDNCKASTRQPFLRTLKNTSFSQRARYQSTNSSTSASVGAFRLVNKRHWTGVTPSGEPISLATIQVTTTEPVLPTGNSRRRAQSYWRTCRAFCPCLEAMVNTISPRGSPACTYDHSFCPSGGCGYVWHVPKQSARVSRS